MESNRYEYSGNGIYPKMVSETDKTIEQDGHAQKEMPRKAEYRYVRVKNESRTDSREEAPGEPDNAVEIFSRQELRKAVIMSTVIGPARFRTGRKYR